MKKLTPLVALALLGACTTPADVTKPLSAASDPNAKVNIVDTANGFSVEVSYSRYQFIPETSALLMQAVEAGAAKMNVNWAGTPAVAAE